MKRSVPVMSWQSSNAAGPVVRDDPHLVVADAVDPVLLQEGRGVVDQELPDVGVPEREHQPAGPALVGEVEAVVLIAVAEPVVEPEALRIEPPSGVIVDEVEDHRDPVQVGEIDQALELVHAGPKRLEGHGLGAEGGERRVDRGRYEARSASLPA